MIMSSVDTRDFSQIVAEERFSVDAPQTNPLMAASSLDVTRTGSGLEFSVIEKAEYTEPRSVEQTLQEVIVRSERDLQAHPQSTRSMVNLALALINAGQTGAGADLLRAVINAEPSNYVALTSLALLFFNLGALQEATETYLRLHSKYPRDPSPLINLASIELRRGDFIAASSYLERAVALDGCSAMAKHLLAMVLLRLGKHNQSVNLLRSTLRESGPSAELNQGLAIAYLVSGDLKKAERAFLTALAINKKMVSAVHGLAVLRFQQKRFSEVIEGLLDHLSHFSGDGEARELLAGAYVQLGQFARARGQLTLLVPAKTNAKEERAELARISNNIGFCFAHEGKANDAELWFKRSIDLDGISSAAPYTNWARLLLSHGRFDEALNKLSQVDKLNLAISDSALLKSAALVNLERHDEAIEMLQSVVNTGTAAVGVYAELGWLLSDWQGSNDAAIAVLRDGYAKDPSNPILLNNLAYVHLMRGEPAYARAVLDQVKDVNRDSILLTATRGLLLLWEGNIEEGEGLYKRAEAMAFQSGQRDLAISIRQKRHLELSRAYLRSGRPAEAVDHIRLGLDAPEGYRYFGYRKQLAQLAKQLVLPSDTQ